jgi:K+-transporting ATPase ATPase C chain
MLQHLRPALACLLLLTLLLGVAYPLAITGVAQAALPSQANGSLIRNGDRVIGSALIGQPFSGAGYLASRPSAAGDGYDASASAGSNLGPINADLLARVKTDADALRAQAPGPIPADAVTTSGSGLDPDISPANALRQAPRIAAARGTSAEAVRAVIQSRVEGRLLGFIGQPRVNVLLTNRELDVRFPGAQPPPA